MPIIAIVLLILLAFNWQWLAGFKFAEFLLFGVFIAMFIK